MVNKKDIRDFTHEALIEYLESVGEKPFRAGQIFDWIYKKGVQKFSAMANLPTNLRAKLKRNFLFKPPLLVKQDVASDKTTKFLFELDDHQKVESVLIPTATRCTVCVSTQIGCKFSCKFCASGLGPWLRDLSCHEIAAQILYAKNVSSKRPLSHVVFMGTGEPLDNYDNLMRVIRIINCSKGLNIAARRITISTVGLLPQIKRFMKEGIQIELAVSLHGPNDEIRNQLVPINKKYPVQELITVCKEYIKVTRRQITFEYILIKDVTCTQGAAQQLGQLLKGMICKINLIPYNKVNEFACQTPSQKEMISFQNKLTQLGVHATVRHPRGRKVNAACGQLRYPYR